jgi:hypothetical protein
VRTKREREREEQARALPFFIFLIVHSRPRKTTTTKQQNQNKTEWGNPTASVEAYKYIQSYSPYDNVATGKEYPHILATGGLHDP